MHGWNGVDLIKCSSHHVGFDSKARAVVSDKHITPLAEFLAVRSDKNKTRKTAFRKFQVSSPDESPTLNPQFVKLHLAKF
jgi:hypothetical protein